MQINHLENEPPSRCSGCGAVLPPSRSCLELRDDLFAYTLTRPREEFIHQHAVDAYAAQHVNRDTKPIMQAAALIGLFLFAERGFTGRQVQQAHVKLGNRMKDWRLAELPAQSGSLTVVDALSAPEFERDEKIRQWARAVWELWKEQRSEVEKLLQRL